MKTERPILFNSEMVRAVLDGRKTQTRRVMKPQPSLNGNGTVFGVYKGDMYYALPSPDAIEPKLLGIWDICPYGVVGDQLWVRETHALKEDWCDHPECGMTEQWVEAVCYKADGTNYGVEYIDENPSLMVNDPDHMNEKQIAQCSWRPSIHMPRWASRIQLEVTGVRVERVQNISEDDAMAEGVVDGIDYPYENGELPCPSCNGQGVHGAFGPHYGVTEVDCTTCDTYIKRFRILWDSINAKRGYGWDKNPWVWVVEFKMIDAKDEQ